MSFRRRPVASPPDSGVDEYCWQGDHDPYLGQLAREGRRHRAPPPPRGLRVEGPVDDGDPYLAELARARFNRPGAG
jgi:hypothetical protein